MFQQFLFYVISLILVFNHFSHAQNTLTGRIIDRESLQPLEFAQIAIMLPADSSLVTGSTSNLEGQFRIETRAEGDYLLRISFVGYEEKWKTYSISPGQNELNDLLIQSAARQLGEVQISAAAALFRSEADRRIFNVENMTVADGGTAIQLLETLPSVQIDEEGRISLRGSGNILIYINGRPTNLSSDDTESILEQYPANAIKEVELITNPSARYEAEGIGGIINIVLREERFQGFNGQVNISSGTGNKYSIGANINYRQGSWNVFTNYAYQYREMWEITNSIRQNVIDGGLLTLDQDYYTENWSQSHLLRLGTEYQLNSKASARIYANINARSRDRERLYTIRNFGVSSLLDSLYERILTEDQSRMNYEVGSDFTWQNDNGRRLRISATYAWDGQDRIEYFDQKQSYFGSTGNLNDQIEINQFYERPLGGTMLVMQAEYDHSLAEDLRFETGARAELRFDDRSQRFGQLQGNDTLSLVLNGFPVTNAFTHNRDIYAAFASFTDNRHRLTYQLGLRAEYTMMENWQDYGLKPEFFDADFNQNLQPGRGVIYQDNYIGFFPSAFVNFKISTNQDLQASYSRRINRPGTGSMMPLLNAQDFFNLRLGNPFMQPQNTDNFEVNYIRAWENYMVTGGVFHRYTTNGFTRLFVLFDKGSMVTWTNANTQNSTGVELINYFTLNNSFDATLTGNFYYSEVTGQLEGRSFSNENYSWTLSLMSNWSIPRWFSTQVSASYWGPRIIPQGIIRPVFGMNIGMRRNIMNNQATISVNLSDVFNSRKFSLETNGSEFFQEREFYRESRILTLAFTYRFRDFRERNGGAGRTPGIDGDINGLF